MRPGPPLLYAATAGGLALSARAVLGHPLPTVPAAGLLLAYGGLVLAGLKVPWLGMWGEIVCDVDEGVALTMDDPGDDALLRLPDAEETPVTVFALADEIVARKDAFRALTARGHGLALSGTAKDVDLAWVPWEPARDALVRAKAAVGDAVGAPPTLVRPRTRTFTPRLLRAADEAELAVVGWRIGRGASPSRLRNGAVVDVADDAALAAVRARAVALQLPIVSL